MKDHKTTYVLLESGEVIMTGSWPQIKEHIVSLLIDIEQFAGSIDEERAEKELGVEVYLLEEPLDLDIEELVKEARAHSDPNNNYETFCLLAKKHLQRYLSEHPTETTKTKRG